MSGRDAGRKIREEEGGQQTSTVDGADPLTPWLAHILSFVCI